MILLRPPLLLLIRFYRAVLSPVLTVTLGPLGFGCRYHPTCSQYALDAIQLHGTLRGSFLSLRRLSRCHPWGGSGYDPVPPATGTRPAISSSSVEKAGPANPLPNVLPVLPSHNH